MGYLEDTGYQKGHTVWRFHTRDRVIYRNSHRHALKFYWDIRDRYPFSAYVRTVNGWQFVVSRSPAEMCICGREFTDTPNKEPFKYQTAPLVYTIGSVSTTMQSPTLCMVCYYGNELKQGRWAPRFVRQQLGLEN